MTQPKPARLLLALFALAALGDRPALAQGFGATAVEPAVTALPSPTPLALPVAQVAAQAERTLNELRGIDVATNPGVDLGSLDAALARSALAIDAAEIETSKILGNKPAPSQLEDLEIEWASQRRQLEDWRRQLDGEVDRIEAALAQVAQLKTRWTATRSTLRQGDIPAALVAQTGTTLQAIKDTGRIVTERRNRLLALQARIGAARATVERKIDQLSESRSRFAGRLLVADSSPLWALARRSRIDLGLVDQTASAWQKLSVSVSAYSRAETNRFVLQMLALLALVAFFAAAGRHTDVAATGRPNIGDDPLRVLRRPVAAAVVGGLFLIPIFHPDAPTAVRDLLMMVVLAASVRLLPRWGLFANKASVLGLALLSLGALVTDSLPPFSTVERLLLLTLAPLGFAWARRARRLLPELSLSRTTRVVTSFVFWGMAAAFMLSLAANVIGNVSLARMACLWTINLVGMVLVWAAGALVAKGLVALLLRSRFLLTLQSIRTHRLAVRNFIFQLIDVAAVLGWFEGQLNYGPSMRVLRASLPDLLQATLHVGTMNLSLRGAITLGFGLWLVFIIAKVARYVLEEDALPRLDLPRGIPNALSILVRYGIVLGGVFFVSSAVGIDLSSLAIVIGALSVGIGFGLQNVVNNFISGLILLFERPIQPGDTVEINTVLGTVSRIGIRSSTLRTFNGAEVILPNGDLVSGAVTNWTLSDARRRVDIPVGVAYGTDPHRVLEILLQVAASHPEILADPGPVGLFAGFGASSLDFELRVWLSAPPNYLLTRSQLLLQIHDALGAADIALPFPQRDLHLRSIDPTAAAAAALSARGK